MITSPEGTNDLLPSAASSWIAFKAKALEVFSRCGYLPIETPIIERTNLFMRGIGEATDIVSKEMYTAISSENLRRWIEDEEPPKQKSRLSLRPEGTAGVVRAIVQHDLVPPGAAPVKFVYAGPMFRAERPQKDRYRQFNQLGIECLGSDSPTIDAEAIAMLAGFIDNIGLPSGNIDILINSIGCDTCRPSYRDALQAFLFESRDSLCETCNTRAEINPLRAFDCKQEECRKVMASAPRVTDHLCPACREHFEDVKSLLDESGVRYTEDPSLVRGLDYYTRTVFEVQATEGMGAQNALGGGGRYDKLAEEIGGRSTPGFGFALGYERFASAMEVAGIAFTEPSGIDVFIACACEEARRPAFRLAQELRAKGISADIDHQGKSLKAQLKLANKLNASLALFLGPDELEGEYATIRDMRTHEELTIPSNEVVSKLARKFE